MSPPSQLPLPGIAVLLALAIPIVPSSVSSSMPTSGTSELGGHGRSLRPLDDRRIGVRSKNPGVSSWAGRGCSGLGLSAGCPEARRSPPVQAVRWLR